RADRPADRAHPHAARQHPDHRHAQPAPGARHRRPHRGARRGPHRRVRHARRARREPPPSHARVPAGVRAGGLGGAMLTNEQRIGIFFIVGLVLRFIALTLGTPTAKRAEPGDTLEGETPAGLAEVVDKLSTVAESVTNLTDNLNRNAERLLGNLADVVEENRGAIGATAQNLASITGKLDRGTGTLGLLLNDRALYDRVTDTMGDVRQSVGDLGVVAHKLAEGRSTLGKLVSQDDGLYAEVRETVENLNATARNAAEITDDLRAGQGTVGKALTDDSLYTEAQDTLRTVNRATQSVEDQSAISLLGTIVTSLF